MRSQTPLWQSHPITYLVQAKFPDLASCMKTVLSNNGELDEAQNAIVRQANEYRTRLAELTPDEVSKLVEEARVGEADRQRARLEKEENERPFNRPHAAANFAYWSKMSYWTLDEVVALSLGKSPGFANWKVLEPLTLISPFARAFAARRQIVMRAKEMGQLSDKTTPANFLAWSQRMKLEIPPELVDAVTSLGVQVMDWKSLHDGISELYEQLKTQLAEERAGRLADAKDHAEMAKKTHDDHKEIFRQFDDLIAKKNAIIDERDSIILNQGTHIEALEAASAPPIKSEKAFGTRERESLLKLVIGMAVKGYSYNPKSSRTATANEIAGDLALVGLSMDEDTVRKYLAEGKELLPVDETERA